MVDFFIKNGINDFVGVPDSTLKHFISYLIKKNKIIISTREDEAIGIAAGVSISGVEVFDFWLAMALLGVGWHFTYTAATSLMTTAYTPVERAKTQGMMNQIIYTVVAIGALSSGGLVHFFGWNWVNVGATPLLATAAIVTVWFAKRVHESRTI